MNEPEKQQPSLTKIIYIHISLKPEVLQTDDHTGRVFDFLRDPEHQYGRRMIDDAIRQQHPKGKFDYNKVTPKGFVLRWEGNPQVARREIDGLAKALLLVTDEVRRRISGESREIDITHEPEYAACFRKSKYT